MTTYRNNDDSYRANVRRAKKSLDERLRQITETIIKLGLDLEELRGTGTNSFKMYLRNFGVAESDIAAIVSFTDQLGDHAETLKDQRIQWDAVKVLVSLEESTLSKVLLVIEHGYSLGASEIEELEEIIRQAQLSDQEYEQAQGNVKLQEMFSERALHEEKEFRRQAKSLYTLLEDWDSLDGLSRAVARNSIIEQSQTLRALFKTLFQRKFPPIEDWGFITNLTERRYAEVDHALSELSSGHFQERLPSINPSVFPLGYERPPAVLPVWCCKQSIRFLTDEPPRGRVNMRNSLRPLSQLNAIELCAGIGGQAIGVNIAGFQLLALYDKNETCIASLAANRPIWNATQLTLKPKKLSETALKKLAKTGKLVVDFKTPSEAIGKVLLENAPKKLDLIAGGLPWAPWTDKEKGESHSEQLHDEAKRLVEEFQPRAFFFETIDGFLTAKHSIYLNELREFFAANGYHTDIFEMKYPIFGIPQNKTRIYLVGVKNQYANKLNKPVLFQPITRSVADLIADLAFPDRTALDTVQIVGEQLTDQDLYNNWSSAWITKFGGVTGDLCSLASGLESTKKKWQALGFNLNFDEPEAIRLGDALPDTITLSTAIIRRLQGLPTTWIVGAKTPFDRNGVARENKEVPILEQVKHLCDATPPIISLAVSRMIHAALTDEIIDLDSPGALDIKPRRPLPWNPNNKENPRQVVAGWWRDGILATRGIGKSYCREEDLQWRSDDVFPAAD